MTTFKGFTTAVAVGGAVLFGSLAFTPAQQGTMAGIDVDRLAAELGISGEAKADLTRLNDLLERRARAGEEAVGLQHELSDVFATLLNRLTSDQRGQLQLALRESHWGAGHMTGHMGGMEGYGCEGAFHGMHGIGGVGHHSGMWRGSGN
jgi:hypothetical protein